MFKPLSAMVAVWASVWFTPSLDDALKVYVITASIIVTIAIHVVFNIRKLRDWIVDRIVADVLSRVFRDPDVQKLLHRASQKEHDDQR